MSAFGGKADIETEPRNVLFAPIKPSRISYEPTRRADILRIPRVKNLKLSPNEIPGASTSSRSIVILPVIRRGLNLPGQKAKIYAGHHFGQPEGRHGEIDLMHRSGGRRHGGWRAGVHVGDRSPRHDFELGGASS